MLEFDVDGFDELSDKINDMQEAAEGLEEKDEIRFDELFRDEFMKKYTDFDSINAFFEKSAWDIESRDDFEEIPTDELDNYVQKHSTLLNSWGEMVRQAKLEYVANALHLE